MAADVVPKDIAFTGAAENPFGVGILRENDTSNKGYFCPIKEKDQKS